MEVTIDLKELLDKIQRQLRNKIDFQSVIIMLESKFSVCTPIKTTQVICANFIAFVLKITKLFRKCTLFKQ